MELDGMKSVLDEIIAVEIKQRRAPEKILLDLLEAELGNRTAKTIPCRLAQARCKPWTKTWIASTSDLHQSVDSGAFSLPG